MNTNKSTKVIVGLSGGVDSSTAALLLKEEGYQVEGLFMKNWEEDDTPSHCTAAKDLQDVKSLCNKLNIPLHTVNFAPEYWENVFSLFLDDYAKAITPNPDILCNKEIKFKSFLQHALKLGADYIATGHYAQSQKQDSQIRLLKGSDGNKDQSYFLYTLNQSVLEKTLFPIGHLEKKQVRAIAKEKGLATHDKKDSTGICFIGERKFKNFLQDYLTPKQGEIQTPDGTFVGKHDGLAYYTLGQRKGLGIGGKRNGLGKPWYVIGKNVKQNILFVTQDEQHPWHFSQKIQVHQVHWVTQAPVVGFKCLAKARYRQSDQVCHLSRIDGDKIEILFEAAQRAVTPGQSLVLYDGNFCLGGGIIAATDSLGGIR